MVIEHDHYWDSVPVRQQITQAAHWLADCEHIYTTGCGKSARVADLFAEDCATLTLAATFIPGGDLMHGGMGRIKVRDGLVMFSASAQTAELCQAAERVPCVKVLVCSQSATGPLLDQVHSLIQHAPWPVRGRWPLPAETPAQLLVGRDLACAVAQARGIDPGAVQWAHPANQEAEISS